MSLRDHWVLDLACSSCGNTGTAGVSEEGYPFLQDPRFSVDRIEGTFSVERVGQTALETLFKCERCGRTID
jgi:hypothetical protein